VCQCVSLPVAFQVYFKCWIIESVQAGGHGLSDIRETVTNRLFTPFSRFESLILSHHSRYEVTCECNEENINDDDDDLVYPGHRDQPPFYA